MTDWRRKRLTKIVLPEYQDVDEYDPAELIANWIKSLENKSVTELHIRSQKNCLLHVLEQLGVNSLSEVTALGITRVMAELSYQKTAKGKTRTVAASPRMKQKYLQATRQFFNWCAKHGFWTLPNPANAVELGKIRRQKDRRGLTQKEFAKLIAAAPKYRQLTYLVAATTGYRRNELNKLKRGAIDLDSRTIQIRGALAKNRETYLQPIIEPVAMLWEEWLNSDLSDSWMTPIQGSNAAIRKAHKSDRALPPIPKPATFDADLKRAGIEKTTELGTLVFHSLRYTLANEAIKTAGTKGAQEILRHSTPDLTSRYAVQGIDEKRKTLDKVSDALGIDDIVGKIAKDRTPNNSKT